jgi:uncharacterized protein (TIGR02271 family)
LCEKCVALFTYKKSPALVQKVWSPRPEEEIQMPTRRQSTVIAVFRDGSDANAAAAELKANGFTDDNIYISSYSGSAAAPSASQTQHHHEGGIKGWFKSLFGEDEEQQTDRDYYEGAVSSGNVLLSVEASEEALDKAVDILDRHDPVDVNTGAATESAAPRETGGSTAARQSSTAASANLPKSIPVVQEEVQVGKRAVARGGVRVYSRIVEQPVEESVRLQEEHVRVERQPVNRPVESADLESGREQVIEVQEFAEQPVVSKQARVVEEVRISKDATERTETVRDTVRRTEVDVENLDEETPRAKSARSSQ